MTLLVTYRSGHTEVLECSNAEINDREWERSLDTRTSKGDREIRGLDTVLKIEVLL